jgi:hypothetical protein
LIPDVDGLSGLPAVVGLGRAKELVRPRNTTRRVQQLVDEMLACAPVAVGLAKRVMDVSAKLALAATLELEVTIEQRCSASANSAEGAAAFARSASRSSVGAEDPARRAGPSAATRGRFRGT